jgi:hypothetical protein
VSIEDAITDLEDQNDRFTREMRRFGAALLRAAAEAMADGNEWVKGVWDDEDELVNATDFFIYARDWAEEALKLRETYDDPQDGPEHHVFTAEFEDNAKTIAKMGRDRLGEVLERVEILRARI